jgi:O-antigen ligase
MASHARPGPPEESPGALAALLLAATICLAPALGARDELMLQDTLKSIVVAFGALAAGIALLWDRRDATQPVQWHAVMWLPLQLMVYALGSIAWSHAYLASVEAIRWFLFALIVWIGLNSFTRERLPWLAWGIFLGGFTASLWAALQFWTAFSLFPQGPPPSSTFVNRNFFAEFAICTLPFGAILLARARLSAMVALLAVANGLVIVAVMMTGTRGALMALWLQLVVLYPYAFVQFRRQLAIGQWGIGVRLLAAGALLATVAGLGMIPTGNDAVVQEGRGLTALERGVRRTASISPDDHSLGVRAIMWRATLRVIQGRPLSGVGAGAWESEVPLYQEEGAQLETDFYVHNEYLQLIAEYGIAGWLFLLGLLAYLYAALKRTLLDRSEEGEAEGPWRAIVFCSLASFMVVSSIGFPWRMAATGALFALCLAVLAASDLRLGAMGRWSGSLVQFPRPAVYGSIAMLVAAAGLAGYISWQAAQSEKKLVAATQIALAISRSANPADPRWEGHKREMLRLAAEGVAINPHYRKVTPIIADELGRWGAWREAIPLWESVLASRPNIVAIMTNTARGYLVLGELPKARAWLDRAKALQPRAKGVRSLEVLVLGYSGQDKLALDIVRADIAQGAYDFDLVNAGFAIAARVGDYELAERALNLRMKDWPYSRIHGLMQLGSMHARRAGDSAKALAAFKQAQLEATDAEWRAWSPQVPAAFRSHLGLPDLRVSPN